MDTTEPIVQLQPLLPTSGEDTNGELFDHDVTSYLSTKDNGNINNTTNTSTSDGNELSSKYRKKSQPNRFPLHHRTQEGRFGFDDFKGFADKSKTIYYCFALFILYFVIGTMAYSVFFDKWSFQDSMYFTVVTFTTCGYGDLTPDTTAEYVFTIFFLLFGVLVLATVAFGIVFENLFESYDNILEKAKIQTNKTFLNRFESVTQGAENEQKSIWKDLRKALIGISPLYILLVLGALLIGSTEQWGVAKTLYFMVVTSTTVGYGDVSPSSESMRMFCVFYIPFAVGVTAELFGRLTGVYLSYAKEDAENDFLSSRLTLADIDRMDRDGDGVVVKEEFLRFFLVSMGKISHKELDKLEALFERLDATRDGHLSPNDLVEMSLQTT
jgi:potassium channel subfamily K